jgi:hypothetical protein
MHEEEEEEEEEEEDMSYSQESATGPYPESHESNPDIQSLFL